MFTAIVNNPAKRDTTLRCIYKGDLRHNLLLMNWWRDIVLADELSALLAPSLHAPLDFCTFFEQPDMLRFCIDTEGIWLAFWVVPIMNGAYQGLWLRPSLRKSKLALETILRMFDWGFSCYPVLISLSMQLKVVQQLCKIGYSEPALVPGFWPGHHDCYFQYQTREEWAYWSMLYKERHGAYGL